MALVIAAAPTPLVSVSVQPALGGTLARGAPSAKVAAGETATVALAVRAPVGASLKVGLASGLMSPKGAIGATRVAILPIEQCAAPGSSLVTQPAAQTEGTAAPSVYWMRTRVPRGQPAGRYRATVRVSATLPGRSTALQSVAPVEIEVLPFDLVGASRQYLFLGRLAWDAPDSLPVRFREYGFLTMGVTGSEAQIWPALSECQAAGVRGAIPVRPAPEEVARVEELEALRRQKQLPPVIWIFPGETGEAPVRLGGQGIPVGAVLGAADTVPDPPVDTLIRRVDPAAVAAYLKSPIPPLKSPRPGEPPARRLVQWWSWDTAAATPAQNRLFSGFLLWRAGFTGACVEEAEADAADAGRLAQRWEAIRLGVDDVRHLTTYYGLLRQLRDKDRRHPLPDRAEADVSAVLARLTPDSSLASADFARRTLVRWIVALRQVVG
jgi:hypothetical protein